ncbi:hydrophobic surface binding protein A-domain-containing protein [Lophiotrema nucula]|uniref:Hydrophobic surface binding protein A-domain-containing protein n=1 Tax=Lophiotrema nucula TaxID=690887 RepID=A0A6A5ZLX7_9PLEO|nr:hydrophobic surface binding protein A-domain-containing protein [Lophiotrema nucula]
MLLSTVLLTCLPLASALPKFEHRADTYLERRASDLGPQIRSQLDVLNASVIELTAAVNKFDGTLLGVLPQSLAVIGAETKLDATIVKLTILSKQTAPLTADESESVVTTLASLLTPIQTSLTAITDKYPEFKKTLESPIVLLDLKTLKAHTDDLITALTPKVTSDWAGFLTLGQGVLDSAFDAAIAVYSG